MSIRTWLSNSAAALIFATLLTTTLAAQQPKVLAPHKPFPPRLPDSLPTDRPLRSMVGGLWVTDANFKSSIYLTNHLTVAPLVVTPFLYLSNGKRLTLPDVNLEPSGTSVVSVNDALQNQHIAPWSTLIGYAEVDYYWPSDVLCVTVDSVDVAHSTIFDFSLRPSKIHHPTGPGNSQNIMHGMWWKEEPNVTGFVALSNSSEAEISAIARVSGNLGASLGQHAVKLGPHSTKRIYLPELQAASVGTGGGLDVAYSGSEDALIVNGGLEDPGAGYSAHSVCSVASAATRLRQKLRRNRLDGGRG